MKVEVDAMSACGPSQHFAPPHDFGRKRGIAEVDWQPSVAEGGARDPKQTLGMVRPTTALDPMDAVST